MERLSYITSKLIILYYLKPRAKIADAINLILENKIKRNKNKMLLFLILILLCTVILPLIIIYSQYPLIYRLKWAVSYLLFFSFIVLLISAYYDARLRFNKKEASTTKEEEIRNLEFKVQTNNANLVKNLLFKNAFECDSRDLTKVLSNESPSNQISITYVGANGRLSYHNLFFTFHYILKNGINDLTYLEKKELLKYISIHFKKGDKNIKLKTLNQNYNDWLKHKFSKSFENEFLKEFVNHKQSVTD